MTDKGTILVVDDDTAHRTMLRTLIGGWGYRIEEADDGSTAIEMVMKHPYDLILMDIRMVRVSGLEALSQIKVFNPSIPIIIMTAYSSVDSAVEALKKGAYDYLTKPLDFEVLKICIERAMEHRQLKEENLILRETLGKNFDTRNIVARSESMLRILDTVSRVAPTESTVLITGESGTGKELIAGAIHFNSPRKHGPFIKINCAAVSETLLDSELFGHEKGAFTGAHRRREGKFELANGGTIFLDEVSEMSLLMQAKILRAIQEKEITRVGGDEIIKVDVRVIAATNKDLETEIQQGRFREDLFWRLNVVSINIPPLRERRDDIPLLADHFLKMFASKNNKQIKGFTPKAMDRIIRYMWPGNVRQLMNAIESAVVLSQSPYIDENDLPLPMQEKIPSKKEIYELGNMTLEEVEKMVILRTLRLTGGNKSETARKLGITRKTLNEKLKRYGYTPEKNTHENS
jgi:two-component system response regulator HydG